MILIVFLCLEGTRYDMFVHVNYPQNQAFVCDKLDAVVFNLKHRLGIWFTLFVILTDMPF